MIIVNGFENQMHNHHCIADTPNLETLIYLYLTI